MNLDLLLSYCTGEHLELLLHVSLPGQHLNVCFII